jgi:solute carrier family 29 (equilibrative nucleoside transporter), member 1/2/3
MLCLASLTFLLTLSTFFRLPEGVFATTTIVTGITLAATGSYLQTSVIAIASLFGPTVIQSMLSGQAVVAVTLSAVQLISATTSLRASEVGLPDGVAETKSARLFFGISTTFLIMCGAANVWMTRLPSYRAVVPCDAPWIRRQRTLSGSDSPILGRRSASVHTQDSKAIWDHVISVTRRNIIYELAVAYVFMVTLVSRRARSLLECHNI